MSGTRVLVFARWKPANTVLYYLYYPIHRSLNAYVIFLTTEQVDEIGIVW